MPRLPRSSNSNRGIWTPTELSKTLVGELKKYRVAIKRNLASPSTSDIIRDIDDPKAISQSVHGKTGTLTCAMFDRDDIVVNPEEQFVSVDISLESSRPRNVNRSASTSSGSPEYNRRDHRRDRRSKEKVIAPEIDEDRSSRSERTPVRDGLRRRSRSPSTEERKRSKCRSSSREYRRRSRSKSKSVSRELLDRPSCSARRCSRSASLSPRPTRKSRSPLIRKRSSFPQRRRTSGEKSERRRSRSRNRTPRRSEANYRDRLEERRSRSPVYHSSRRRGSRSRSPPSGRNGGRRSLSRERRRMRSRSPRYSGRPRSRSRSPYRNGPRVPQEHMMDPHAAAAMAVANYFKHMPPKAWMTLAATAPCAAAAMRLRVPGGPVPNCFFGMGARPNFPLHGAGGPPLYQRYPLLNYNTLYRPAAYKSTTASKSTTAAAGGSGDEVTEVPKLSNNGDDKEAKNSESKSESHEKL